MNDLRYIVTQHFPARTLSSLKSPSRPIRTEQQRSILLLFNYQLCDSEAFQPLHEVAQQYLTTAGTSNESGKYYASLVKFYTTYKLQRMKEETQLYLLFFAFHRFMSINVNLIEVLIHWVDQYEKQAKRAAEEAMSNRQTDPSLFPTEIILKGLHRYLFRKEGNTLNDLDVDRYEFLVYRLLRYSL